MYRYPLEAIFLWKEGSKDRYSTSNGFVSSNIRSPKVDFSYKYSRTGMPPLCDFYYDAVRAICGVERPKSK